MGEGLGPRGGPGRVKAARGAGAWGAEGSCLAWARAPNGHWQLGAQVLSWKRGWG